MALAAFTVLAVMLFATAWADPLHRSVAPGLDSMNTMWFLRWIPFAVTHAHNPLITTYMDYPAGVNVMWNNADGLPAVGLLTAPLQAFLPLPAVFDLVATVSIALSAWAAYLAISRHVDHLGAAWVGGLVYGFGPYMSAQWLGHIGLNLAFIAPLILVCLEEILVYQRRPAARLGVVLGVLAALQVLLTEEMLATEAVVAAALLAGLVLLHPREVWSRIPFAARSLLVSMVVFVVLAGPAIAEQFLGPQHLRGALRAPNVYVTDLLNLVLPTSALLLHPFGITGGDGWTGNGTEWNGYIGVPLLLVCALAAVRLRARADVRLAVLCGVVVTVLSLGPRVHIGGQTTHLPGLWHAARLPVLQNILPGRLMLFVDLAVGWLLAALLESLVRAPRRRPGLAAAAGIAAVAVLSLMPAWPVTAETHEVPAYFTGQGVQSLAAGSNVLVFPLPLGHAFDDRYAYEPLLWQVTANFRFRVPVFTAIVPAPNLTQLPEPDLGPLARGVVAIQDGAATAPSLPDHDAVLGDLRARRVSTLILGPMPRRDEVLAYVASVLGPGQDDAGVTVWRLDR